jgi:hypothetical protein
MPSPIASSNLAPHRYAQQRARCRAWRLRIVPGLLAGLLVAPALQAGQAPAAAQPVPSTLGVRFREVKQQQYRGCVLNFRALLKNPPDLPDASLIVDGSLAYAVPETHEPPRIGLSVIFSKEVKRSLTPLPSVALAYLQTSNGSTGDSIAQRVPDTPVSVSSFAFGLDQSSTRVVQDLRNGEGFKLVYRLQPDGENRSLPIDTGIADSTFFDGKLIRYPSPRAMRSFAKCIDKLTPGAVHANEQPIPPHPPQEAATPAGGSISGFTRWLRQYAPFSPARAAGTQQQTSGPAQMPD